MATAPMNPAYLLDPSLYGDQQAIDQQRQIAQLLMTQGISPMGGTESVGGVAIRRSPMEGAAKLAQLLSGQSIQRDANTASQSLYQRQAAMLGQMFGLPGPQGAQSPDGPSPLGTAAPLAQGDPRMAPIGNAAPFSPSGLQPLAGGATPAGAMGLPGLSPQQSYMAYAMDPGKYMESYLKGVTPNDTTIAARQGNVDPVVANRLALIRSSTDPKILAMQQAGFTPEQIYAAVYGEASKAAEIERKPASQFVNSMTGASGIVPKIPENTNITGPVGANGQVPGVAPIPGATGAVTGNTAASTAGQAQNDVVTLDMPDGSKRTFTRAQLIDLAKGTQQPAQTIEGLDEQIRQMKGNGGRPVAPADQATLDREIARVQAERDALAKRQPGFPSGQSTASQTTSKESAKDATAAYNDMHSFATTSAPRNISLLQSIQQLADKTLVGPGSDKLQFVNGVLNMIGVKPGEDQAQNYQIMTKNLNMLVGSQRMASAGGGSDALQNLLQAANPNNKEMNGPALKEAAEELIAYNRMMLAKDKAMPNPNATTPEKYQSAETAFAPYNDPRMWQVEHAADDRERLRILSLIPTDQRRKFLDKVAQARKLGLLD